MGLYCGVLDATKKKKRGWFYYQSHLTVQYAVNAIIKNQSRETLHAAYVSRITKKITRNTQLTTNFSGPPERAP